MGFKERNFDQPTYEQQKEEPTRVIIISCEGSNTEPEYFEAIKDKLKHKISSLIEIELVPKPSEASEPKDVLDNLQGFVDKYDFNKDHDSLWLVCDREKVMARKTGKKGLLTVIPLCNAKGYSIALSNPLFEFWLLLHVADISTYDHKTLFDNEKVGSQRRFIDKKLSDILSGGFNKKKGGLFGHSGFTGCVVWANPHTGLIFIFLSNSIHPRSTNRRLKRNRIREKVYEAVLASQTSSVQKLVLANSVTEK